MAPAETVTVLYFEGCPHVAPLLARLDALLGGAPVQRVVVADEESAQRERFIGSPSVRVDGRDVEPGADERTEFGLRCRLYPTADRLPPEDWILAALGRDSVWSPDT